MQACTSLALVAAGLGMGNSACFPYSVRLYGALELLVQPPAFRPTFLSACIYKMGAEYSPGRPRGRLLAAVICFEAAVLRH